MTSLQQPFDRRTLFRRSAVVGGALALSAPLQALGARAANAQMAAAPGYGPLVPNAETGLFLPERFRARVIDVQGGTMNDGNPTPGIFDGMAAYAGDRGRTVLIRNHENRRQPGEIPVVVPAALRYDQDPTYNAGNTKLVLRNGRDGLPTVERKFAVLGGTDTNCAGGTTPWDTWITCEEVVNRSATGTKHGYIFEVDAHADGPHAAVAVPQAGRFAHEASTWYRGAVYQTEDASRAADPVRGGIIGATIYRYVPENLDYDDDDDDRDDRDDRRRGGRNDRRFTRLARSRGKLQALAVRGEPAADLDRGRQAGQTFEVYWVDIDVPDHDDDTNNNLTRASLQLTPTRVQAKDKGAAVFDRTEGCWVDGDTFWFDCTSGGDANAGQLWALDARRNRLTLVFQSPGAAVLDAPDNLVVVPRTGDVFLQEDGGGEQFVRGVTRDGRIYDFARTGANDSEFCGGCFDPSGKVFFLNQQGGRGNLPDGPADGRAVTYAITGPWERVRTRDRDDDRDDD